MRAAASILPALLVLGCSTAATTAAPSPAPAAAPAPCGWYTAMAQPGQVVNVTTSGAACHDRTVVDRLVADTDRPWTTTAVIPGAMGTLLAQLANATTTVRVWFTGPQTGAAAHLAGRIANAFQAAQWAPQPPTGG
jgi:hypothetical protein